MTILRLIGAELYSMFIDDGALALFALGLIMIVTVAVKFIGLDPLLAGVLLLLGYMAILAESAFRFAARKQPR